MAAFFLTSQSRQLVLVNFHYGDITQKVRIHRGENPTTALRFVVKVLGLPAARADGALALDEEGVPVCFSPRFLEDGAHLFLQLGPDSTTTRTRPAAAAAPAPASASAGAAGAGAGASAGAAGASAAGAGAAGAGAGGAAHASPTGDNSRCWTWDPTVATLPVNKGTITLTDNHLAFRAANYDAHPGNFTMAVIPSSCKFTSGVHRVVMTLTDPGGYQGCGVITEAQRAKVGTVDMGTAFDEYPHIKVGCGARLDYTLDVDKRTLVTVDGGQRKTSVIPGTGPLWFAAALKTTGNTQVNIVHVPHTCRPAKRRQV